MVVREIKFAFDNILNIEGTLESFGIALPKKNSLFLSLLCEILTRYPRKSSVNNIENIIQFKIESCITKCIGYQALMAHDDWVEERNPKLSEMYDHLAKCLICILSGLNDSFPIDLKSLFSEFDSLKLLTNEIFVNKDISNEVSFLLFDCKAINEFRNKNSLEINDFLYDKSQKYSEQKNVSIISSWMLGKTLSTLYNYILANNIVSKEYLNNHKNKFLNFLIRSSHSQAHSIDQKSITLSWKRYLPIAYGKSNNFLDATNCLRFILDQDLFEIKRFNCSRFCEQFYLDDLQDFDEDTKNGIIGFPTLYFIEQGRLAKKLLSDCFKFEFSSPQFISKLKSSLTEIPLHKIHYDGTYIYHNYIVVAERNILEEFIFEPHNVDNVLRELFVNSKTDKSISIKELLSKRAKKYDDFLLNWEQNNYTDCSSIVISSNIPSKLIEGFLVFIKLNKPTIIDPVYKAPTMIYYYLLLLVMCITKIRFLAVKAIFSFY